MKYFLLFLTLFLISPYSLGKKDQPHTTEKKRTTASSEHYLEDAKPGEAILIPNSRRFDETHLTDRMNKYCDLSRDFKIRHSRHWSNVFVICIKK